MSSPEDQTCQKYNEDYMNLSILLMEASNKYLEEIPGGVTIDNAEGRDLENLCIGLGLSMATKVVKDYYDVKS